MTISTLTMTFNMIFNWRVAEMEFDQNDSIDFMEFLQISSPNSFLSFMDNPY